MDTAFEQQADICKLLGHRLRQLRIHRNESQVIFAERLGVSRQTYSKLEKGHPSTPIGLWVIASILLNCQDEWAQLFKDKRSLFDQYEQMQKSQRQRVGRAR